jgi:amino acid adenylation domain-containing protein
MTDMPRRSAEAADLPLSFAQEQLWFIDEFHHGLAAHNMPNLIRLRGPLDVAALGRALDGTVARHEMLRTRLVTGADGRPVQRIDPPAHVELDLVDHAGLDLLAASARLREFAVAEALRPFHLGQDRLLRARLVRLRESEHALVMVVHHTVFDSWSAGVFVRELAALYGQEAGGGPAGLGGPAVQFADYALWERTRLRGGMLAELEDYWRAALTGFEISQFPTDRPRPLLASHDGAVETIMLDRELLARLRKVSRDAGTTPGVTLLAALYALLYRYTGQTDLVVGTVSANRTRPELASLIGPVANMLPIRADLSCDPPFTDLMAQVKRQTAAACAHQDLPFAKIVEVLGVERDPGRFPVFQLMFGYGEPIHDVESGGVVFHHENAELPASMYDLAIAAEERPDGLWIQATYPPALFDAETVRRLLGHFEVVLRGVVTDASARVSRLPVLTAAELHQELVGWNDTAAPLPPVCIHRGFEARAAAAPDAVAAEFEGTQLSYDQLNRWANRIARRLRGLGVGPEMLAGVCLPTGLARLAALLGIWKAGGGYVPLDPALPAARLSFMIDDTAMAVVLTDSAAAPALPPTAVPVITLDHTPGPGGAGAGDANLEVAGLSPANVAYVIYTSGSTGQPKGVVVEHRHAANFLQAMVAHWRIGPGDAVLGFAAFTFDVSVMDMFMPLLGGAKVVLAPAETLHSPPRLAALMRQRRISFACLPPAVLRLLTGEHFPDLRILLSAGEELSSDLLRGWLRDGLDIYNGYGPTEASIGATFMKLDATTPLPPPIGRPKPNYRAYVLDPHLNPVPAGVTGELHIGGAGVARGYLGRPELTAQRFIPDPFTPGARLYKTGDLARRRPDGTIVFAGRADNQIKIRGLRVEPGEIETTLATHPHIAQALVTVTTDNAGEKQLTAYLRPAPGATPDPLAIHRHLAAILPLYMIPTHLIPLATFPLTPNGKIDKTALPAPALTGATGHTPPATLIETILADLFATVLAKQDISAADSFFDIGGNSLQAMQLITQLRTTLAVDLDVSAVFLAPTPQQLAALLRDKHGFDDAGLGEEGIEGLEELPDEQTDAALTP